MRITGRISDKPCPNGNDCPRIRDTDGDDVLVQGYVVEDQQVLDELSLPVGESVVRVPRDLIRPQAITLAQLGAFLDEHHTRDLVRIENRRAYQSLSDGGDFARYVHGESGPTAGGQWHEKLRAEAAQGRRRRKIHVAVGDLSAYERYEFEWGFTNTVAAGEDVRIVEAGDLPFNVEGICDFWVIDGAIVVKQIYGDDNTFSYAEVVTDVADAAIYGALASVMWNSGTAFSDWWAAHPREHRGDRAA